MIILVVILIMSYLIGRLNLIENSNFKKTNQNLRFSSSSIILFIVIAGIKIFIAVMISRIFQPSPTLQQTGTELNGHAFDIETINNLRIIFSILGVVVGEMVGIWRIKH